MRENEYIEIGRLNPKIFESINQNLITDEVIITYERINHIETKRTELFEEIKNILSKILYSPDYIYKDWNNRDNTLILIKILDKRFYLNIILKVAVTNDKKHTKNSIITIIKIGKKTFNKIINNKKENLLFKKLDILE